LYYSISAGRTVKLEMHLTLLGLAGCTGLVGTSLSGTSAHEFQWRSPVLSALPGPVPDNFGVDSAGNAVVQLGVQFGEGIASVDAVVSDIPDGCSLDNVPDDKLADGLVLGASLGAVGAPDGLDVPTVVLVASVVPALLSHLA